MALDHDQMKDPEAVGILTSSLRRENIHQRRFMQQIAQEVAKLQPSTAPLDTACKDLQASLDRTAQLVGDLDVPESGVVPQGKAKDGQDDGRSKFKGPR